MSRTKKLARNGVFGALSYVVVVAISFALRKYFVDCFGYDLVGLNGVLTAIIGTLSIAELGIGLTIAYSLYKPVAENDTKKITALIRLYKKIYAVIAVIVLVIGLAVMPFLSFIVNGVSGGADTETNRHVFQFTEILFPYLIFLSGSVASYFFSFNHCLLTVDQKNYVISVVNALVRIITGGLQLLIVFILQDFLLYIAAGVALSFIGNIFLSFYVRRAYPYLKNAADKLAPDEMKTLKSKIGAMLYHRIGNYFVNGVDAILISIFISVTVVGYFNNYLLISTTIVLLVTSLFSGLTASFGDILATDGAKAAKRAFRNAQFSFFILYTVVVSGIFSTVTVFMKLWLTEETVLPMVFLIPWCVNIFMAGYSEPLGSLRLSAGLLEQDKYVHIALPFINLAVSIALVQFMGIGGIMLGTTFCLLIKEIWVLPRIVYKHIFKESSRAYYLRMLLRFSFAVCVAAGCYAVNLLIDTGSYLWDFLIGGVAGVTISGAAILLLFGRSDEMKYLFSTAKSLLKRKKEHPNSLNE